MKKFSLLLLAGAFLFSCNSAEEKEVVYNDLLSDNLKGDVIMVETTPYKVDSTGKMGDVDSCCITIDEYKDGYIMKSAQKESSGNTKSETIFTHYENGLMKEIAEMKDGKSAGKLAIEIDSSGKYVTATHYDSTGKMDLFYNELSQNKYGDVLQGKQYNADSSLKRSWKNMYDQQYFVGGESKDSAGNVVFESTVKRNDKGDRTEFKTTSKEKDSTVSKTITYQYPAYDENGNWVERVITENGKPSKIEKRVITYATKSE